MGTKDLKLKGFYLYNSRVVQDAKILQETHFLVQVNIPVGGRHEVAQVIVGQ